jgi:ABC-2 type transport system permease protein
MEQSTTMPVIPGLDAPDADEALVSFGIATAVRDAAISLGILLGLRYLLPVLGLSALPITPWTGLGVVAAWVAAVLLVGGLLLRCRDA